MKNKNVEITNEIIETAINSTGFLLEYEVSQILKTNGWQVINSRYYIDDVQGSEREIDIVAYKTFQDDEDIVYYTALIISCKKSDKDTWVFLTHEKENSDQNMKYSIVENISNDERIAYMLKRNEERIEKKITSDDTIKNLFPPHNKVFAFQQINENGNKANDKDIYNSIITSIKALEYEKNQKKEIESDKSKFYNFNLLSIFEGDMREYNLNTKCIAEINEAFYCNRHIINKKESFYRVHFIRKSIFSEKLETYNNLYNYNNELYPKLIKVYYDAIFENREKVKILWSSFIERIYFSLYNAVDKNVWNEELISQLDFYYERNLLSIGFPYNLSNINYDTLNESKWLIKTTQKELNTVFRYTGEFKFEAPNPF